MLNRIVNYFSDILENRSDPRVANLYFMKTPKQVFGVCLAYILFIKFVGPKFMQNRKPYDMKNTIIVYNVFQVITSSYIFYQSILIGWFTKYSLFKCQPVDFSINSHSTREIWMIYIYFLSKFTELLDTVFFVMRKKINQISFLHVYHHISMPLYVWLVLKFFPGGSSTIIMLLNSFIHIVMYTYYLIAAMGNRFQKYLWWKKYLTRLQLIQFVTGTIHFLIILFSDENCNISKVFATSYISLGVIFYILFTNFYRSEYKRKQIAKKEESERNLQETILRENKRTGTTLQTVKG